MGDFSLHHKRIYHSPMDFPQEKSKAMAAAININNISIVSDQFYQDTSYKYLDI